MKPPCVRSCKGLCTALEVAEHHEKESISEFRSYADECVYPDVKELLLRLIAEREEALRLLREKRESLNVRFRAIDSITENYASQDL